LVAVDGSATSLRAGSYAAGLARLHRGELVAVYVHSLSAFAIRPETLVAARESHERIARELREAANERADELGLRIAFLEREGNPYTEIVKLANEIYADAVVVGASMHAGHRFVGSLAARLVRHAQWPVTVVP
jgi:nucleotide-binding universal stress UspA family protein